MISKPRDTNIQSKPWIAKYPDFIGLILRDSTNQMLGFRIFQIVSICRLRALNQYNFYSTTYIIYTQCITL